MCPVVASAPLPDAPPCPAHPPACRFWNDRIYGLLRSALTDADESKAETSLQELEVPQLAQQPMSCPACPAWLLAPVLAGPTGSVQAPTWQPLTHLPPHPHANTLQGLLRELDAWLTAREQQGQPFVGGTSPNATDCYLVPKLNHAMLALREIKGWGLPGGAGP